MSASDKYLLNFELPAASMKRLSRALQFEAAVSLSISSCKPAGSWDQSTLVLLSESPSPWLPSIGGKDCSGSTEEAVGEGVEVREELAIIFFGEELAPTEEMLPSGSLALHPDKARGISKDKTTTVFTSKAY